jgi:hypothetical protein
VLGGVAGGLADRSGVGDLGLRIVFGGAGLVVIFLVFAPYTGLPPGVSAVTYIPSFEFLRGLVTLASGVLVLGYAALWALVPLEGAETSSAGRIGRHLPSAPGVRTWLGTLALLAGAAALGSQIGLWSLDVIWAFLLIGAGVLLFRRDAARANGTVVREPRTAATAYGPPAVRAGIADAEPVAPAPRTPRERSPLGWIVLGLALLAAGGAIVLQNLGAVDLRLVRFPALALLVLGAGLAVGAFVGRARWLVLPSILLVPVVLAFSVVTVPLEGGLGDLSVHPTDLAHVLGGLGEGSDGYRVVAGNVYVDLSAFRCEAQTVHVNASSGFGSVSLYVPFDAQVVATASAGYGQVYLESDQRGGTQVQLSRTIDPRFGDGATIVANLATGIGDVSVYHEFLSKRQREKACR